MLTPALCSTSTPLCEYFLLLLRNSLFHRPWQSRWIQADPTHVHLRHGPNNSHWSGNGECAKECWTWPLASLYHMKARESWEPKRELRFNGSTEIHAEIHTERLNRKTFFHFPSLIFFSTYLFHSSVSLPQVFKTNFQLTTFFSFLFSVETLIQKIYSKVHELCLIIWK